MNNEPFFEKFKRFKRLNFAVDQSALKNLMRRFGNCRSMASSDCWVNVVRCLPVWSEASINCLNVTNFRCLTVANWADANWSTVVNATTIDASATGCDDCSSSNRPKKSKISDAIRIEIRTPSVAVRLFVVLSKFLRRLRVILRTLQASFENAIFVDEFSYDVVFVR